MRNGIIELFSDRFTFSRVISSCSWRIIFRPTIYTLTLLATLITHMIRPLFITPTLISTTCMKHANFKTFCPRNDAIISGHQPARNAPELTYSDCRFKKFPGGETPGPPFLSWPLRGGRGGGRDGIGDGQGRRSGGRERQGGGRRGRLEAPFVKS